MKTVLTKSPEEAAEYIKRGGIVAFPTETVYGLGANVFDEAAVARIFEAKRRPVDNPLIAHVSETGQIRGLATEITDHAEKFIKGFFPGPLTVVLVKADAVPLIVTAGLDTVGVRMPQNKIARAFLAACGVPVVAPSANISGRPSPTTWEAVFEDLDGRIDCILQGEATEIGLESTVIDCAGDVPLVLRSGSVTIEQLRKIVPATILYTVAENEAVRSPGLKHKHYSPAAKVIIVDDTSDLSVRIGTAFIGLNRPKNVSGIYLICADIESYAHSVFEFFRECDRAGIEVIYCESVEEKGIGTALMDRIQRATAG